MREGQGRCPRLTGAIAIAIAAMLLCGGCAAMTQSASIAVTTRTRTVSTHLAPHADPKPAARLPTSTASSTTVQRQPPPGSCHARRRGLFSLPDAHCTPGARSPKVTQSNLGSTICRSGYSKSIRPSESITEKEKLASMDAYGASGSPHDFEYDHLVSLELGGAPNDARNLWPEPGKSPNPKDKLENRFHALVCDGKMKLATAQQQIATDWVAAHRRLFG